MTFSKGFTLLESLLTLIVLAVLIAMAGIYWGWGADGAKERAYVQQIEDLIVRAQRSAQLLETPVALCFALSDSCVAEGMLVLKDSEGDSTVSNTQLLEGLPIKKHLFIRTNFKDQMLVVQAGGQSVQVPGTLYICSINKRLLYAWHLVVARSGRVTTQKTQGHDFERICGNNDE